MANPTSSGTIGATVFRVDDVLTSIARRCGVPPQKMGVEHLEAISGTLWRILAQMSNRGENLWRIYKSLYGFPIGQQDYPMTQGDIDVVSLVYRTPQNLAPSAVAVTSSSGGTIGNVNDGNVSTVFTQSAPNGSIVYDWGTGNTQQIALIGVMSAIAANYNLVCEVSNDNFATDIRQVLAPGSVAYAANGWNWYEIEPPGVASRYFRVRETGGATLSLDEIVIAAKWSDVAIARWNRDTWVVNPSKRSQGTPRQYNVDRQLTPKFSVWPVPGTMDALNLMVGWVHRHIEDVGTPQSLLNIPERWYQTIIDTCSWVALPEIPDADLKRYDMLKGYVDFSLIDTEKEERDRAPIQIRPNIAPYTR